MSDLKRHRRGNSRHISLFTCGLVLLLVHELQVQHQRDVQWKGVNKELLLAVRVNHNGTT